MGYAHVLSICFGLCGAARAISVSPGFMLPVCYLWVMRMGATRVYC